MVIPDLIAERTASTKATLPIEIRHIGGPDGGGRRRRPSSLAGVAVLAHPVRRPGSAALLLDFGDAADSAKGFAVLALYDLSSKPSACSTPPMSPIDRSTYFRDPGKSCRSDPAIPTRSSP